MDTRRGKRGLWKVGVTMKMRNLVGNTFGKLTVIELVGKSKHGQFLWKCHCECGNEHVVPGESIKSGQCKSCGCLKAKVNGQSKDPKSLYSVWRSMLRRCNETNHPAYRNYGGRGITVCERWHDYLNFEADVSPRPDGLTLDRVDNNGPYSPSNFRWATMKEQSNNRRPQSVPRSDSKFIEYMGDRLSIREWALRLGLKKQTLLVRLKKGWTVERAMTEAV